jgi:hypothetical protein
VVIAGDEGGSAAVGGLASGVGAFARCAAASTCLASAAITTGATSPGIDDGLVCASACSTDPPPPHATRRAVKTTAISDSGDPPTAHLYAHMAFLVVVLRSSSESDLTNASGQRVKFESGYRGPSRKPRGAMGTRQYIVWCISRPLVRFRLEQHSYLAKAQTAVAP